MNEVGCAPCVTWQKASHIMLHINTPNIHGTCVFFIFFLFNIPYRLSLEHRVRGAYRKKERKMRTYTVQIYK